MYFEKTEPEAVTDQDFHWLEERTPVLLDYLFHLLKMYAKMVSEFGDTICNML